MVDVQAVLFDLDGTLLHDHAVSPSPSAQFARSRGLSYTDEEAAALWHHLLAEHFARFECGEISHDEHRRARLRGFDPSLEHSDDATLDAVFASFLTYYEASLGAYNDALPALAAAHHAGHTVGILTNGDSEQQRKKFRALNLTQFPVHLTVSGEVGVHKPDPEVFHHACAALGSPPANTLMVGDNHTNDVEGALNAGLQAVWLNRITPEVSGMAPTITSLSELLDHIASR